MSQSLDDHHEASNETTKVKSNDPLYDNSKITNTRNNNKKTIRLLLHAVDGVVPYLTPKLLHYCFPATSDDFKDVLWIGMAVKDTCVGPVFAADDDDNDNNHNGLPVDDNQQQQDGGGDGDADNNTKKKNKNQKKARGYTFSSQNVKVDSWMLPYTRVTVPTFDMVDDHVAVVAASKKQQKQQSSSEIIVTDQHVLLWTPHGRQILTPDLYMQVAAHGLQSHVDISLFDTIPPVVSTMTSTTHSHSKKAATIQKRMQKRKDAAIRRTQLWHQQHHVQMTEETTTTQQQPRRLLWSPLILDDNLSNEKLDGQIHALTMTNGSTDQEHEESTNATASSTAAAAAGVALIGWSHLDSQKQSTVMERLLLCSSLSSSRVKSSSSTTTSLFFDDVAILSTNSLDQILHAVRLGINVIGSNLPTKWALHKMAFICDIASWRQRKQRQRATMTMTTTRTEPVAHKRPRIEDNDNNNKQEKLQQEYQQQKKPQLNQDGCVELAAPIMHPNENGNDDEHDDITLHAWFRDDRPMLPGCTCHACKTHSRAYIYHLVCAKELLAEILLFIHNLHHLLVLIRECNHVMVLKHDDDAAAAADDDDDDHDDHDDIDLKSQQSHQQQQLEDLIHHVKSQLGETNNI